MRLYGLKGNASAEHGALPWKEDYGVPFRMAQIISDDDEDTDESNISCVNPGRSAPSPEYYFDNPFQESSSTSTLPTGKFVIYENSECDVVKPQFSLPEIQNHRRSTSPFVSTLDPCDQSEWRKRRTSAASTVFSPVSDDCDSDVSMILSSPTTSPCSPTSPHSLTSSKFSSSSETIATSLTSPIVQHDAINRIKNLHKTRSHVTPKTPPEERKKKARSYSSAICHSFLNELAVSLHDPEKRNSLTSCPSWLMCGQTNIPQLRVNVFETRRKLTDFEWLYEHLRQENLELIIPALPSSGNALYLHRHDDRFLAKKGRVLQDFMSRCCRHEKIKMLPVFHVFLCGTDAELRIFKKLRGSKPPRIYRCSDFRRCARNVRALTCMTGTARALEQLIDCSTKEIRVLKTIQDSAKSKETMHDTWRTMSSSDLESGYLANVFSEMAECTQSLELDVAKSNIKAEREYRERLSFLLAYVETAICYVEYLDDIDETLAHWANQVHNIQRSIGECDQSARTLTDKGGANKTEKELCSLQKKLRMASESEAEVGLLMDRLRSASGKELSYYELVKEEDLKVAHYQRTKALATACDKKLHAYQNVIKILQYPVQIREPAYNLVADSKQAQCGEHSI